LAIGSSLTNQDQLHMESKEKKENNINITQEKKKQRTKESMSHLL
jgi:hypothetical protein